jgi:hypothetical protein
MAQYRHSERTKGAAEIQRNAEDARAEWRGRKPKEGPGRSHENGYDHAAMTTISR